mmetsp:Transcript_10334/g.15539  ORF Transcript_10334/g.15539 Transcript_10334/m.15539 type:complete len:248 (-) Transcript_10334:134-877(-)
MDNQTTGEIEATEGSNGGVTRVDTQPSISGPDPVSDNGVGKGNTDKGENQISNQLSSLSHTTRSNGSGSGSKSKRVKPNSKGSIFSRFSDVLQGEVVVTNEGVTRSSKEGKSEEIPTNATNTHIHNILEQQVHNILGSNHTGFKQHKTQLHQKHKGSHSQNEKVVDVGGQLVPHGFSHDNGGLSDLLLGNISFNVHTAVKRSQIFGSGGGNARRKTGTIEVGNPQGSFLRLESPQQRQQNHQQRQNN